MIIIIIFINVDPGTPVLDLNFDCQTIHAGVLNFRAWVYEFYLTNLSLTKHTKYFDIVCYKKYIYISMVYLIHRKIDTK